MQGSFDADRLSLLHVPVTQLNTANGFGGECHLDANMVRSAIDALPLADIDLLVIENVGNLVCPAEFRVGEDARIMVCSVTEGEDKPLKYPLMFRACELVLVNKIDLLEHLDFDLDRLLANLDAVHPGVRRMLTSARTGEGVDAFREWLATSPGGRAPPRESARPAACRRVADRSARARRGQRALLLARGRAHRPPVPPDGRALRARRAAGRRRPPRPPRAPTRATWRSSSSTP